MADLISWFDESEFPANFSDQEPTPGTQEVLARSFGLLPHSRPEVRPVDPDLPELVLLHGITDCHLANVHAQRRTRIWLDPVKLVLGQYTRRLTLENDGLSDAAGHNIQTDGVLDKKYAKALDSWRASGFLTHTFCYDWRKSVLHAADRLGQFLHALPTIQAGKKVVLVCHSMGGLVAAAHAARNPGWQQTIEHCVFVGSPLAGSYSAALAIMGLSESFQKMDRFSIRESLEDFQRMAASFPGLIDLLPNPEIFPEAKPLFDIASWPGRVAPDSYWLIQSRNLKSIIWNSPIFKFSTHLISQGLSTVAQLEWDTENRTCQPSSFSRLGDGSVLNRSSIHPKLKALKVTGEHGMLCTEPMVINAVQAIARKQDPQLQQITLNDLIELDQVPTSDARSVTSLRTVMPIEATATAADQRLAELSTSAVSVDVATVNRLSENDFADFDREALLSGTHDWKNLLSLAAASELAYQLDSSVTRKTAKADWGFKHCMTFDVRDTQGFIAWDDNLVLLSYRGSEKNVGDWLGNLNLAGITHPEIGKIHRGFSSAFDDAFPFVDQILEVADAKSKKTVITGHSLGGALAVLAGTHYARMLDIISIVTFGQPKLGQKPLERFFDRYLSERYLRVVNNRDVVAMIPPNYNHFGKLIHFDENGNPRGAVARTIAPTNLTATKAMDFQPSEPIELDETQFEELQSMLTASSPLDDPISANARMLSLRFTPLLWDRYGVSAADHSITNAYIPILVRLNS